MDVREKLVEIVEKASARTLPKNTCHTNIVMLVNALIEEGVTVQEWIPVTERLPENICPVLVVLEGISTAFNGWYHDGKWWTVGAGTRPFTQKVTHWMPLPQPPKGE